MGKIEQILQLKVDFEFRPFTTPPKYLPCLDPSSPRVSCLRIEDTSTYYLRAERIDEP